jgi:hypothetical protein
MQRNRNWVWFFAAVAVLGAAAVAIPWVYNARQQLTRQQLEAAEDLWAKRGPADYDLAVEKKIQSTTADEVIKDEIHVRVRNKKVVEATMNGRPLERRLWDEYDVDGWFGFVERFLQMDSAAGAPRTFRAADFDPQTGQLLRFRRHVSGTHERQELVLRLTPV